MIYDLTTESAAQMSHVTLTHLLAKMNYMGRPDINGQESIILLKGGIVNVSEQ